MKNYFLAILSIAIVGLSSCTEEEVGEGTLTMKYETKINNTPLVLNQTYDMDGDMVYFTLVQYYVSGVSIQDKDATTTIELKDVELVDVSDESTLSFSKTLTSGAYKSPSFTLGLSDELNATDPSTYESDHPMSLSRSTYWLMANAYIYFKIEGFRTINGVDEPFVYHVGANGLYRDLMADQAVSINKDNTTTIVSSLDLNSVFSNVDFATESETHTGNNMPLAIKMMDNFANAISIN